MEIQPENGALAIKGLRELDGASLRALREAVGAADRLGLPTIEVDLSQVGAADAAALGVLASLYRLVGGRSPLGVAPVRLLNPQPGVQQMLELARMDHLFEIARRERPETERALPVDLLQAA